MSVHVPEDQLRKALGQVDELESLGGGGQGLVWRVKQHGRERVVKVIPGNADPVRIAREIDALKAVNSPRVMSFFETLTVVDGAERWPAIVGEYIPGGTVADRLVAGDQPSPANALLCCRGVFEGIAAIHAQERVHRDVKPQNVALRGGQWADPVVLDLGLVRDLEDSITRYPNLVGTLPFMAPEQLRQERAVKRTDVFGTGAMLFLLLTGELPYYDQAADANRSPDAVRRTMLDRVEQPGWPRWSRVQQTLDSDIADLLARLLAVEAYERPTVAAAMTLFDDLLVARGM
jgi:serine/threonine protein kinase